MSSHSFTNSLGREVKWGLDLPTGGFFYNEFFKDEEIKQEGDEELASYNQGLTLSQFRDIMLKNFDFTLDLNVVGFDIEHARPPTPLQHNVSSMFGVNLQDKLVSFSEDLEKNWS
jgi:hypothetical protein